jgi:hypothetical protein
MEVSVREIIRETKNAVNARFDMLESMINIRNVQTHDESKLYTLINQQNDEIDSIKTMLYRFNDLVANVMKKIENMEKERSNVVTPLPSLNERMPELYIRTKPELTTRSHYDDDDEDSITKNACYEVNVISDKNTREKPIHIVDDKIKEVVEEEELVEEEVVEEEGIELEEFEYKGMTLYRDTENKVYRMDEEGALSDALGVWDETKQRIKKL